MQPAIEVSFTFHPEVPLVADTDAVCSDSALRSRTSVLKYQPSRPVAWCDTLASTSVATNAPMCQTGQCTPKQHWKYCCQHTSVLSSCWSCSSSFPTKKCRIGSIQASEESAVRLSHGIGCQPDFSRDRAHLAYFVVAGIWRCSSVAAFCAPVCFQPL